VFALSEGSPPFIGSGGRASTLLAVGTLVFATIVVSNASAAPRTTTPVFAYKVVVELTDKAVTLQTAKAAGLSSLTLQRGAVIQFVVTNRGTRPYKAELKLIGQHHFTQYESKIASLHTVVLAPKRTGIVRVSFYFRSRFALQALLNTKPHGSPAIINIV
jgi:hypothetical protein